MPNPIMPGLIWDPGRGAGYRIGRNAMRMVKVHFTAGTNSYAIVKNGVRDAPSTLAQFLLPKSGVPWQFTEVDALCYDSGPYNDDGPGIEWERLGTGDYERPGLQLAEPLTADQITWGGRICQWLHDEWGVPLALYDGPRFQADAWRGFVNHGDLDNQRSDGVTRAEWDALTGDDMNEQQVRDIIDQHVFIEQPFGMSRFVANLEQYLHTPTIYKLTRFEAWWAQAKAKFEPKPPA